MPVALGVRVLTEEPVATEERVPNAEPDTVAVAAGEALTHAVVVTEAHAVELTLLLGELETEEDAVVDRDTTTDTEEEPESDLEPLSDTVARALVVARAVAEVEPVPENVGSEEAV